MTRLFIAMMKRWYASIDVPIPPGSATQPTTPKRWRPRFSVRTLVILVTFVCFYFGMWEATKRQGVADVNEYLDGPNTREINPLFLEGANASAPVPLIAVVDQPLDWVFVPQKKRYYYFWFSWHLSA